MARMWHAVGHPRSPLDHLDANYRRARQPDGLGSSQALSTVVHASGCASLLLYVLLYGVDVQVSGQLGQILARSVLSAGVGLFLPKPSRDAVCQGRDVSDLERTVRRRPLASAAVGGDCYSLGYSASGQL